MYLKRIFSLFAVLCFSFSGSLWGQQSSYELGQAFLKEGESLDYFHKYQEALPVFMQAFDCFEESDSLRQQSAALASVGNLYIELGAYDSAQVQFDKALVLAQQGGFVLEGVIAEEGLAKLMFLKGESSKALTILLEVFAEKKALLGANDIELAVLCNYIGGIYGNRGDFELAANYFSQGLDIRVLHFGPDDQILASSHYNLSNCLLLQGNFEEALQQMQKALYVMQRNGEEENRIFANIYGGLGSVYLELDQLDKAGQYLEKADSLFKETLGPDNIQRQMILINLAKLYRLKRQLDRSIGFLEERLALQKKYLPMPHILTIITLESLGKYHVEAGRPAKGLSILEEAKRLVESDQSGRAENQIGHLYLTLGNYYLDAQAYEEAINYYQKALDRFSWGPKQQGDRQANPPLDKIVKWPFVLEALHKKAMALMGIAQADLQHPDRQLALETFLHAAKLIDRIRVQLKSAAAQKSLSLSGQAIFEEIINLAYQNYQADRSQEALELAFWAAEKNKAFLLLRNTQKLDINRQQILPDSLLVLEARLKADISYLETQLYQQSHQVQDSSFRERQNELFGTRQTYDSLTRLLESQYPRYFQAQYPSKRVSIAEIQELLPAKQQTAWIEYAWCDTILYAFVIQAQSCDMIALKGSDSLVEQIRLFCQELGAGGTIWENTGDQVVDFSRQSYQLFRQLWQPLAAYIPDSLTSLVIIPDRELFQLPFELLLTKPSPSTQTYKKLPYLLHKYQIHYDASATIWTLQSKRSAQPHNEKSLIFAYGGNQQQLATDQEAKKIQQVLQGNVYSGATASKNQFQSLAPQYGLLHLACHARLDDLHPKFSALFLAPPSSDSIKASQLYVQELFHMELRAELAVLSACETGNGKYLSGEGQISLTYGFLNAGVPAVVMSLWQVEDHSTQKLMQYFYQNLAQGMSKDQALRQAKLEYLKLADPLTAHPRFWAAFVAQGNMQPVSFLSERGFFSRMPFWLIFWLILGILAIYLGMRARNAKFSGISKRFEPSR